MTGATFAVGIGNNEEEAEEFKDGGLCSGTNAFLSTCFVGAACCTLPVICNFISTI